jgi:hypothetical protein
LEGSVRQTGIILATAGAHISRIADNTQAAPAVDNSLETRLTAVEPLPARPAHIVHTVALGGAMKPYAWLMNEEFWPHITPLMLNKGQRNEIELGQPLDDGASDASSRQRFPGPSDRRASATGRRS